MKTIMFLLRYLCLLALILVAVYAPEALLYGSSGPAEQMPCYETIGRVWSQWLQGTWYRETWFLITAAVLLVLSFARGVTAIWNVLYALSLILMMAAGSLFLISLPLALPSAIGNMPELQFLPTLYRTEAALVSFIPVVFILGLLLSNARIRIFLYTIVCYALWYGLSELFTYLLSLWQQAETPFMPELLAFLYDTQWLLVALIGAFLLVYDLILSFSETFTTPKPQQPAAKPGEEQPSTGPATSPEPPGTAATVKPATSSCKPAAGTPKANTPATPVPTPKPVSASKLTAATTSKPAAAPAKPAATASTPKLLTTPAPAPKPAAAPRPSTIAVHRPAHSGTAGETAPATTNLQAADVPEPAVDSPTTTPAETPPPAPMPIANPFTQRNGNPDDAKPASAVTTEKAVPADGPAPEATAAPAAQPVAETTAPLTTTHPEKPEKDKAEP